MVMIDLSNDEHMILLNLVDIKRNNLNDNSLAYVEGLESVKNKLEDLI